jgi:hypothetical protein
MTSPRCVPSTRCAPAITAAAVLLLLAGSAHAQIGKLAWTNLNAPNNAVGTATGNITNANASFNAIGLGTDPLDPPGPSIGNVSLRLQIRATATEDKNDAGGAANVRDRFSYHADGQQVFATAGDAADIYAPGFLRGAISFLQNAAAPNANFSNGRIQGRIAFERRDPDPATPGAFIWTPLGGASEVTFDLNVNADTTPAGGNIDQTRVARINNAPANTIFRINASLTITGDADRNNLRQSDLNSGVRVTPHRTDANDLYSGLIVGVSADDRSAPNSRAMVAKQAASTAFPGITGAGVLVGVLEPGRVIATPDGLAGARPGGAKVIQLRYRGDEGPGLIDAGDPTTRVSDSRSEHTTAVAGIIAGDFGTSEQQGVAPGARILSAPTASFTDSTDAFQRMAASPAVRVMNMSARLGDLPVEVVDKGLNDRPNLVFVKSAGNDGPAAAGGNTITTPGMAYNGIAVGAVDINGRLAGFSSTNASGAGPFKPDLVAPGVNVLAPMPFDSNGDNNAGNDFERKFGGSDARYFSSVNATAPDPTLGAVRGTSFAAPHVAGVAALMHNLGDVKRAAGDFDARSDDARVLKAVMMNTATRNDVTGSGGRAWSQKTDPADKTKIIESIDRQLGAGKVNALGALVNYNAGEALQTDTNTADKFNITPRNPDNSIKTQWWDLERVKGRADVGPPADGQTLVNGTVNYALPTSVTITPPSAENPDGPRIGTFRPAFSGLKAALTWNRLTNPAATAYESMANLELRLYVQDGLDAINQFDFNPDLTRAKLLFQTSSLVENTKVFDLDGLNSSFFEYTTNLSSVGGVGDLLSWTPKFFLQVVYNGGGQSGGLIDYGLSVIVPTPSGAALLVLMGLGAARRRRA